MRSRHVIPVRREPLAMAMQPRGLPLLSRGYREIDVSEQLPGRQQISDFKRQVRGERARREQCRRDAHCSGKGGSHQFKVGSSAISITPEQGGGKATGSQECPRNPGTANSLVRPRVRGRELGRVGERFFSRKRLFGSGHHELPFTLDSLADRKQAF